MLEELELSVQLKMGKRLDPKRMYECQISTRKDIQHYQLLGDAN